MRRYAALLIGILWALDAQAGDWPYWRGPQRNDHVEESSGFTPGWPGPPQWTARVGEGSSSPVIIGQHVYVLGWSNGHEVLACLDLATGQTQWQVRFPGPRHARYATGDEGLYSGPTSTPEYDPQHERLYLLSSDGWLRALDLRKRGKEVWSLNLYDRFQVSQRPRILRSGLRDYGYTTSPMVVGDWLLVEVGAKQGLVMAFDKHFGKHFWSSEHAGPAGHTGSPVTLTVEGVPCLAVLALSHLVVLRLDGSQPGRTVATFPWETEWANNILTPAVNGHSVLISSYHTHHAICRLDVTLQDIQPAWKQPYASHVGSPVIDGDHIYFCGSKLHCLDWQTGKEHWSGGSFADGGSMIKTLDDRLVILGSNGVLGLVESARRSPEAYRALAQTSKLFNTDAWPHVVLAQGRILCKDRAGNLLCFDLSSLSR
jgi:outer membrane protein assembly factor BamB